MTKNRVKTHTGKNETTSSAESGTIRRVARSDDELREELLEGIPNEVTLNHIATLLPRGAYEEVAKINREWQRAFEGRMVYDARVRSQNTQTFFIVRCRVSMLDYVSFNSTFKDTLSLFSPSEERWYKFPPIPGCREGMVHNCSYVILDCSIYLLGGTRSRPKKNTQIPSSEVLVLDLTRHPLEWRRCANMLVPRRNPAIGVMHGKIFVFGWEFAGFGNSAELYDPKVDVWSFTAPPLPSASIHLAFSVDEQFFACTGWKTFRPRLTANTPEEPPSKDEADVYRDRKFVVTVGDGGPKLISTRDDNAEDDMDGLHATIEKFVDLGKGAGLQQWSPADSLAHQMRSREGPQPQAPADVLAQQIRSQAEGSFFGLYDPVKDEWEVFEKERFLERMKTAIKVDLAPDLEDLADLGIFGLTPRLAHFWDHGPGRDNNSAMAFVWPISL